MAHQRENISFAKSQLLIDIILNEGNKEYRNSFGNHTVQVHAINHDSEHAGTECHTHQGDTEKGDETIEKFIFDFERKYTVQDEVVHHSQRGAHDIGYDVVDVQNFVKHIKQPHVHDQADNTNQCVFDKARV